MQKANWRECREYFVHGEAKEVCIVGPEEPEKNVCMEAPKLPCSTGMLFFNRAYLEPGRRLEIHRGMTEELHYILEGTGIFTVNGEECEVSEGDTVYVPCGSEHGLFNPGPAELKYLVLGPSV